MREFVFLQISLLLSLSYTEKSWKSLEEFENGILIKKDKSQGPGENSFTWHDDTFHHFRRPTFKMKKGDKGSPKLWPKGRVPYKFATQRFHFTKDEKKEVRRAMTEFHRKTCIKFVTRTNQRNFIKIVKVNADGDTDTCESLVGKQGGGQEVTLGPGCYTQDVIIHELMHALGFYHEHTRKESREFVTIKRKKVKDGDWVNFEIHRKHHPVVMNSPYDICSIMHYDNYALIDKHDNDRHCPYPMGEAKTFSKKDLKRLQKMYKCY